MVAERLPNKVDRNSFEKALNQDSLKMKQEISNHFDSLGRPGSSLASALKLIVAFELFAKLLYRARKHFTLEHPVRADLEDFGADFAHEFIALGAKNEEQAIYSNFIRSYRKIWAQELYLFVFTLILFLSTLLIGWQIGTTRSDLVPVIVPQHLMEQVIHHDAWFESLQKNPFMGGIQIALNNIQVSINCFLLGALLGIGGLIILCFNGLMIGTLMGFCAVNGFSEELSQFIIGHGPLELTIIIAASFTSLLYGRTFFQRPWSNFLENFRNGAKLAGIVLLGVLPWLILAACIECFVSPFHYLTFSAKMTLGLVSATIFWIWTFWPQKLGNAKFSQQP